MSTKILKDLFGGNPPPFSVVAQSPAQGLDVALYAEALSPEEGRPSLEYRLSEGIPYCSVRRGTYREIHGAGVTVGNQLRTPGNRYAAAFQRMSRILEGEQISLGQIVRQWNYIEDILGIRETRSGLRQNYQEFNDVRRRFYTDSSFPAGYPAATGIGMSGGGFVLEFQAVSSFNGLRVIPLSNPLQKDPHRYSQDVLVGDPERPTHPKAAPLFERGKYLGTDTSGAIFISGTAAIRRQVTFSRDVESQTRNTIENIAELISRDNLRNSGLEMDGDPLPLSYLRVYAKQRNDLPRVKEICQSYFGDIPSHFLTADICREDLLVELEGVAPVKGIHKEIVREDL